MFVNDNAALHLPSLTTKVASLEEATVVIARGLCCKLQWLENSSVIHKNPSLQQYKLAATTFVLRETSVLAAGLWYYQLVFL